MCRATDKVLLPDRAKEHPGQCAESDNALSGEPREGQPAERTGLAALPDRERGRSGRPSERERTGRSAAQRGRRDARCPPARVADNRRDQRGAHLVTRIYYTLYTGSALHTGSGHSVLCGVPCGSDWCLSSLTHSLCCRCASASADGHSTTTLP